MERPFYNPRFHANPNPVASYEGANAVSMTEPDLGFSLETLVSRFTRGMPINGIIRPVFYDDRDDNDEFIDPRYRQNRDLTDSDYIQEEYGNSVSRAREYFNHYASKVLQNVKSSDTNASDPKEKQANSVKAV